MGLNFDLGEKYFGQFMQGRDQFMKKTVQFMKECNQFMKELTQFMQRNLPVQLVEHFWYAWHMLCLELFYSI